ncbi:hypothetical protein E2C01_042110 [Portunus trituberculatus]|uniref:Uncharacterized protein n=1 Tax=Portunus trituberculatus TaxID=210409 RepID=A0A5B7FPB6_PORTR|nr:hypothetical protein [Portunus trituberculatus]
MPYLPLRHSPPPATCRLSRYIWQHRLGRSTNHSRVQVVADQLYS